MLKTQGYPDFMEKKNKDSYPSDKVLGTMYRRCLSLSMEVELSTKQYFPDLINIFENICGNVVNEEELTIEVNSVLLLYKTNVRMIINRFGLSCEKELFLCDSVNWDPLVSADKGLQRESLRASWSVLKNRIIECFYSNLDKTNKFNMWNKIYIWYKVAYEHEDSLCLPWILSDIICEMITVTNDRKKSVEYFLGQNAFAFLNENVVDIHGIILRRQRAFERISTNIQQHMLVSNIESNNYEIRAFGSFALCLCEHGSDIDIFVNLSNVPSGILEEFLNDYKNKSLKEKHIHLLDRYISPALEVDSKESVFNTEVPIIRCAIEEGGEDISIDICLNKTGFHKASYIQHFFRRESGSFPLFAIVFRIFRSLGLIPSALINKSSDSAAFEPILKTTELHALILSTYERQNEDEDLSYDRPIDKTLFLQEIEKNDDSNYEQLGFKLIHFFKMIASKRDSGVWTYEWLIPNSPRQLISSSVINKVADVSSSIIHYLSYSKSISFAINGLHKTLNNKIKTSVEIMVSSLASKSIIEHTIFHIARLEYLTGAKVKIARNDSDKLNNNFDNKKHKGNLMVIGYGDMLSIRSLRDELKRLMFDCKINLIGNIRDRSSAYFMKNAACIYIPGLVGKDNMICCVDYHGPTQLKHRSGSRKVPLQINIHEELSTEKWIDYFISSVQDKIISQLYTLRSESKSPLIKSLKYTASFGIFYLNRVEAVLESMNGKIRVSDLEKAIHRDKKSRKDHSRAEYINQQNNNQEIKMIKLSSGNQPLTTKISSNSVPNSKVKKNQSISSGFYPSCINSYAFNEVDSKRIDDILTKCNFKYITTDNNHKFKVTFSVSATFSMEVLLNANLQLDKICQKPLSWIHGTVLNNNIYDNNIQSIAVSDSDNIFTSSHHVRFKLQTHEPVKSDSDMFKIAYPINETKPPIYVDEKNDVIPSKDLIEQSLKRLVHIRHTECRIVYQNEFVVVNINNSFNYSYSNGKLLEKKHFSELSLNSLHDNALIDWLQNKPNVTLEDVKKWSEEVLRSTLSISEHLRVSSNK